MADALTPSLRAIRQQEFYADPRFHASIGWALLDNAKSEERTTSSFPTIACLPPSLLSTLNEKYSAKLASLGAFDVDQICVKIGKEICRWRL